MSDDLRIPAMGLPGRAPLSSTATGYRARVARGEPAMRLALFGAAGLGGLLLVGMAGYAVMGRRPATVPVILADGRPMRVKPENAGGMQFAGADELGGDAVPGSEKMAPVAETPAPQALRAQMQQAAPVTEPVSSAAVVAPALPASVVAGPVVGGPVVGGPVVGGPVVGGPGSSPLPDTPGRPGAGAKPQALAGAGRSGVAGMVVQLGALSSEGAALAEWQKVSKGSPDVFAGHQPAVQKTERDGRTFWRLRTGGFADMADATAFCMRVRAKGGACTIASF